MVIPNPQMRFVRPVVVLTSLLLVGLCVVAAESLLRQQTAATDALRENLDKRRAAGDLEQSLRDLQALLKDGVDKVGVINARVEDQLQRIRKDAGGSANRDKIDELEESYGRYYDIWKQSKQPGAVSALKIAKRCRCPGTWSISTRKR
jgi:hypothetical protein